MALLDWLVLAVSKKVRKLRKENKVLRVENEEFSSQVVILTEAKDSWRSRHDAEKIASRELRTSWERSELEPLVEENKDLKAQNRELQILNRVASEEDDQAPSSVQEVVATAESEYGSLLFFDDARRSAKKCQYEDASRVLELFREMDEAARDWFAQDEGSGPYEKALREKGFDVAPSESRTAYQARPRIFSTRNGNGREVKETMLCHIKLGVSHDPRKTMRVHYKAVRDHKKVVIGYCGEHLPIR